MEVTKPFLDDPKYNIENKLNVRDLLVDKTNFIKLTRAQRIKFVWYIVWVIIWTLLLFIDAFDFGRKLRYWNEEEVLLAIGGYFIPAIGYLLYKQAIKFINAADD